VARDDGTLSSPRTYVTADVLFPLGRIGTWDGPRAMPIPFAQRVVKRAIDCMGSALGMLMLGPLMLGIALAIRLDSRGPALFRQRRLGRYGKPFRMWKFRTMVVDAEARLAELEARNESPGGVLFKIRHDPRVTRVGRFLRRTSLDELPQLINVLRGEMSLVGPRPLLEEVDEGAMQVLERLLEGLRVGVLEPSRLGLCFRAVSSAESCLLLLYPAVEPV
jgi:lipopolysaccharide/colanic/teichoic acid biosynthesis glycosyltransferase